MDVSSFSRDSNEEQIYKSHRMIGREEERKKKKRHTTINWSPVKEPLRGMNLDYMESLCIKLHRTGPGHGFNEDEGRRVYTKQWDPVLNELRKKERLG